MTQHHDQPSAFLHLWWNSPNWSRLLPVLGGTLLAPIVLVTVSASTPHEPDLAPDVAFAPTSPLDPVSPVDPTAPFTPIGSTSSARQVSPIAPSPATAVTNLRTNPGTPGSHVATPASSTATATEPLETIDAIPATVTMTAPPPPSPAAPAAASLPRANDISGTSVQSGSSCAVAGEISANVAGAPAVCSLIQSPLG